jgi:small subunit ribosomal protein S20
MANTRSAKKNVRKNELRRIRNNARRSSIKTAIKKVQISLETKPDAAQLDALLKDVAGKLARAKGKNVLHPNTAARKLSRLAKRVSKALQTPA